MLNSIENAYEPRGRGLRIRSMSTILLAGEREGTTAQPGKRPCSGVEVWIGWKWVDMHSHSLFVRF